MTLHLHLTSGCPSLFCGVLLSRASPQAEASSVGGGGGGGGHEVLRHVRRAVRDLSDHRAALEKQLHDSERKVKEKKQNNNKNNNSNKIIIINGNNKW